ARATGTSGSMKNISQDAFLGIRVLRPPLEEQKAIADVLSVWDRGIRLIVALKAAKLRFRQGLFQQLLTGNRRFTGFGTSPYTRTTIASVFEKLNQPVKVSPNEQYAEIGIRSHGRGVFHKEPVAG